MDKYFKCEIHQQHFKSIDALKQHVLLCHSSEEDGKFQCNVCNEYLNSKLQLERHKKQNHLQNSKNKSNSNFKQTLPTVHHNHQSSIPKTTVNVDEPSKSFRFQCHICSQFLPTETAVNQHLLLHLKDSPLFNDQKIKVEDEKSSDAMKSKLKNASELEIQRDNSDQEYFSEEDKDHEYKPVIHSSDEDGSEILEEASEFVSKPSKDIKNKKFKTSKTLKTKSINLSAGKYKCYFCNKRLHSDSQLEKHIWLHTKEKTVQCYVCRKYCFDNQDLNQHLSTHGKQLKQSRLIKKRKSPRYRCNVCCKALFCLQNLTRHMVYHSGQRPFKCTLCENSFQEQRTLDLHMLSHSDERPNSCKQCDKAYKRQADLNRHVKTAHFAARPYKCLLCSNAFKRNDILNDHISRHHK